MPWADEADEGDRDDLDDLASHPEMLKELRGARAAGVSWRRFTGWEPVRTTTLHHDESGRPYWVTVTEPEWDDEQRAAVYALARYEESLCPGCRRPWEECTNPDNEGRYKTGPAVRCHACTTRSQAQALYADADHVDALHIPVWLEFPDGG